MAIFGSFWPKNGQNIEGIGNSKHKFSWHQKKMLVESKKWEESKIPPKSLYNFGEIAENREIRPNFDGSYLGNGRSFLDSVKSSNYELRIYSH